MRYNQSAERNRPQDGKRARNEGIEMENITKRVDDSFKCSKKMAAEKKSQIISSNYSVAQVGHIIACSDVDRRIKPLHLTC